MRASRVRLEENYEIRMIVTVDSKTAERSETRAIDILGAAQTILADDPKVSAASTPPSISWCYVSGYEMSTTLISEGEARTQIEADIAVKARNA